MVTKLQSQSNLLPSPLDDVLPPSTVIDTMIDLKIQLYELEQQIKALQPLFYATCVALNTSKIELERAVISRRLTPAQWTYDPHILEQQDFLKSLKQAFQDDHEPTRGRDVVWSIKLLLSLSKT